MGLLSKLFGKKSRSEQAVAAQGTEGDGWIRVYDSYGRELALTKEQWRDNVLLGNLERVKDDPEQLYSMLAGALDDGFAADIVPYAEHLRRTDPNAARGATLLGVVYLQLNRLDDAERVFEAHRHEHGDEAYVLTNLAKVYAARGDEPRAEETLWRGLTLDPNQENAFGWYVSEAQERGGDKAAADAIARVAELPGSWRARIWQARSALERRELGAALRLYDEALAICPRPVPADMLMQLSGDLGNHGHLVELIKLTAPHFDADVHGLQVGNNLLKANVDLGRVDHAQALLEKLYALERPDFQETLSYWDTEIAKARVAAANAGPQVAPQIAMLAIPGPVWLPPSSLAAALFPVKAADAVTVAFLGGSASAATGDKPHQQMADTPGRLSRSLPLFLAEQFHLRTDGLGRTLQPYVPGHGGGLVLSGEAWPSEDAAEQARGGDVPADYVVVMHLDADRSGYRVSLRLIRTIDGTMLEEASGRVDAERTERGFAELAEKMLAAVERHTGASRVEAAAAYQTPTGAAFDDYALRLEQALAVAVCEMDGGREGFLHGEREMLGGLVQFCLDHPQNATVRTLLAQTTARMKSVRPNVVRECAGKIRRLHEEYPLDEPAQGILGRMFEAVLA